MIARVAQNRLGISIYRGQVKVPTVNSADSLLAHIHATPGVKLLAAATMYPDAHNDIARLHKSHKITTYDGRIWANPGPPFDPALSKLWHASIPSLR